MQQKADFRALVLERNLSTAKAAAVKQELVLDRVQAIAGTASRIRGVHTSQSGQQRGAALQGKLSTMLSRLDAEVATAEASLIASAAAHNSMVNSFYGVLKQHHASPDDLGFAPVTAQQAMDAVVPQRR